MIDDEDLITINVESLVDARDVHWVDEMKKQLTYISTFLEDSHVVNSLCLTTDQLDGFFWWSFWLDMLSI